MSALEVRGGGLVIRGAPSPSAETGLFVGRDGLQGWQGLPSRRREAMARAVSDGEFDVPVRLPARVITIDPGVILARSEFELQQWCDQVNGWGATGLRFWLVVDHLGQQLTSLVRVISAEGVDLQRRAGGMLRGSMAAQLVAADPRKYAVDAKPFVVGAGGGAVLVPSRGNFPATPTIETPPAPAAWSVSSPAGTGGVTRNGVWMPGVGRGRIWAVPNGTQWEHTLSAPGRVLLADTYV